MSWEGTAEQKSPRKAGVHMRRSVIVRMLKIWKPQDTTKNQSWESWKLKSGHTLGMLTNARVFFWIGWWPKQGNQPLMTEICSLDHSSFVERWVLTNGVHYLRLLTDTVSDTPRVKVHPLFLFRWSIISKTSCTFSIFVDGTIDELYGTLSLHRIFFSPPL